MYKQYPYPTYCDRHWKVEALATKAYSDWSHTHLIKGSSDTDVDLQEPLPQPVPSRSNEAPKSKNIRSALVRKAPPNPMLTTKRSKNNHTVTQPPISLRA
ncbi:hypothetical protein K439DRAFT_1138425 [Ramaria rubella]|nr:hypothetical protein K439DRAFT_1138425 [Ramaria rubella]